MKIEEQFLYPFQKKKLLPSKQKSTSMKLTIEIENEQEEDGEKFSCQFSHEINE